MKGVEPRRVQLPEEIEREVSKLIEPTLRPIRQTRAPFVKPRPFMRSCRNCGTAFHDTEFRAPERGIWANGMQWFCSVECAPATQVADHG